MMNKFFLRRAVLSCALLIYLTVAAQGADRSALVAQAGASNPCVTAVTVPEPSTNSLLLLGLGAFLLALRLRKRV